MSSTGYLENWFSSVLEMRSVDIFLTVEVMNYKYIPYGHPHMITDAKATSLSTLKSYTYGIEQFHTADS